MIAIIDDDPSREAIAGVPVMALSRAATHLELQAIVLSSTEFEDQMADRAIPALRDTEIELVRLYTPDDTLWESAATEQRLIERGLEASEARWLVEHRGERHDALLPIIPPARTELHARRYELAGELLRTMADGGTQTAADVACGTGYGSALLARIGGTRRVIGVDLDPEAVAYATRRYGGGGVEFHGGEAAATGIDSESIDLAASFETIEHVEDAPGLAAEMHRILRPGGRLVISTPNRIGPTPYHVHDFGFPEFRSLLEACFEVVEWIGQRLGDDLHAPDLPPGMWRIDPAMAERDEWRAIGSGGGRPDFLIAICRKSGEGRSRPGRVESLSYQLVRTPFGDFHAPQGSREPRAIFDWIGAAQPGSVLWDAAPGAGLLALSAGGSRRFAGVLGLEPSPKEHWRLSETVEINGLADIVRTCCAGLAGAGGRAHVGGGATGTVEQLAHLTGVRPPQYLRVAVDEHTDLSCLPAQLEGVRSVWVDPRGRAEIAPLRAPLIEVMDAAGLSCEEPGEGPSLIFSRP